MHKSIGAWCFVSTIFVGSVAFAETPPAEMAGEMLARAQSVDMKCNYLHAADRDALSRLVARAEIGLANRESVEATKATMLRGHNAGKAATCGPLENEQVLNILNAAKQATTSNEPAPTTAVQAAPDNVSVAMPAPEPIVGPAVAVKTQEPVLPVKAMTKVAKLEKPKAKPILAKPISSLGKYQAMTAQYYLASRCGSMPARKLGSFYQSIVSSHNQVMATYTSAQVAQALRNARNNASAQSCS